MADPIPMILYCPTCGLQHVDEASPTWSNPPHRSHLCAGCGAVWRPADVATVGVRALETRGDADGAVPAASGLAELVEAVQDVMPWIESGFRQEIKAFNDMHLPFDHSIAAYIGIDKTQALYTALKKAKSRALLILDASGEVIRVRHD